MAGRCRNSVELERQKEYRTDNTFSEIQKPASLPHSYTQNSKGPHLVLLVVVISEREPSRLKHTPFLLTINNRIKPHKFKPKTKVPCPSPIDQKHTKTSPTSIFTTNIIISKPSRPGEDASDLTFCSQKTLKRKSQKKKFIKKNSMSSLYYCLIYSQSH